MKKSKIKLEEIKVQSFITALDDKYINALIGATADDVCDTSEENCELPDTDVRVCTPNHLCAAISTKCPGTD